MVEQLSCTTCRIRKVRCTRVHPCTHCVQGGFECTFPIARRRHRNSRRQLAQRLENIESKFTTLANTLASRKDGRSIPGHAQAQQRSPGLEIGSDSDLTPGLENLTQDIGRLAISADQSRYSSNSLWTSLSQEITEMRNLLDDDTSHEENTTPSPGWPHFARGAESVVFPTIDIRLDPSPPQVSIGDMRVLWAAYESNVAPLVRIFHHPSLKALYQNCANGVHQPSPGERSVICAVNFAAIVSFSPEDCGMKLRESKGRLLYQYRCAAELAFSEAGLLNTSSISVLQAFVLYLTSVRRCDDTWLVLSWTGIAIRIAMSVGLHRDGSKLGLDNFATEMRRRLWWHLMLLDADLSEAHGVDSLLCGPSYNTEMPTNVNDADMSPGITTLKARIEFTEMTPCLVRYEIMLRSRLLLQQPCEEGSSADRGGIMSSSTKMKTISELQESLEKRFLCHCSEAVPIQWATQVFAHAKRKMLLFSVNHSLVLNQESDSRHDSQTMRDGLFGIATDVVDAVRDLESNPRTRHWGWYFRSDTQWPALVYLLNEVIQRSPSLSVNHAWGVIKHARKQYHAGRLPEPQGTRGTRGMLFRPMKELTAKAFVVKEGESQQEVDHSHVRASMALEHCNTGSDAPTIPQQTYRPYPSDLRASSQMTGDDNAWPSDHLSAFQTFWRDPELAFSASGYADLQSPLFAEGQTFQNFLL